MERRLASTAKVLWHFGLQSVQSIHPSNHPFNCRAVQLSIQLSCSLFRLQGVGSGRGPFKCVHPFKSLISFWHFALPFGISLILLKSWPVSLSLLPTLPKVHVICWPPPSPPFIYFFLCLGLAQGLTKFRLPFKINRLFVFHLSSELPWLAQADPHSVPFPLLLFVSAVTIKVTAFYFH